jgi:nitrogen fixation protein NifU and related proteins
MDIYREKLLDHYNNPRNYGKLIDANAIISLENMSCGDKIEMQLRIENDKIDQAMFEGEGCAIAIAAASILSEYIIGMTQQEIAEIDLEKLMEIMGVKLTITRLKCANLSLEAVKKAIVVYKN